MAIDSDDAVFGTRVFGIAQTSLVRVVRFETWAGYYLPSLELEKCDEATDFHTCSVR